MNSIMGLHTPVRNAAVHTSAGWSASVTTWWPVQLVAVVAVCAGRAVADWHELAGWLR
jgi:hypothetical protein